MSTPVRSVQPGQAGFSLIEVLVSMFIVSLGILALTGLMQASARYGKTSEMRSIATLLANDIADHIRANAGASDPATNSSSYNRLLAYTATPSNTAPAKDCSGICTPSELAQQDMYAWLKRLNMTIPGGDAYIQYRQPASANQRGVVDVWVAWTDPVPSATAKNERPDAECTSASTSSDWNNSVKDNYAVRCVYLQVGL